MIKCYIKESVEFYLPFLLFEISGIAGILIGLALE